MIGQLSQLAVPILLKRRILPQRSMDPWLALRLIKAPEASVSSPSGPPVPTAPEIVTAVIRLDHHAVGTVLVIQLRRTLHGLLRRVTVLLRVK